MPADKIDFSTCVSFLSSDSQVRSFLKLQKSLKHIICGFQWVWTSCLKWCTSKWFNSCTCIWIFSRRNEMGNHFRIYLISIAARHQKGTDWHIWAGKGRTSFQESCDRHWGSALGPKAEHFSAPKAKPFDFNDVQFSHYKHYCTQRNSCQVSNCFLSLKQDLVFNKKEALSCDCFQPQQENKSTRGINKEASKRDKGIFENKCKSCPPVILKIYVIVLQSTVVFGWRFKK